MTLILFNSYVQITSYDRAKLKKSRRLLCAHMVDFHRPGHIYVDICIKIFILQICLIFIVKLEPGLVISALLCIVNTHDPSTLLLNTVIKIFHKMVNTQ